MKYTDPLELHLYLHIIDQSPATIWFDKKNNYSRSFKNWNDALEYHMNNPWASWCVIRELERSDPEDWILTRERNSPNEWHNGNLTIPFSLRHS